MKELGLFQICSPLGKMSISDPGQETQGALWKVEA